MQLTYAMPSMNSISIIEFVLITVNLLKYANQIISISFDRLSSAFTDLTQKQKDDLQEQIYVKANFYVQHSLQLM